MTHPGSIPDLLCIPLYLFALKKWRQCINHSPESVTCAHMWSRSQSVLVFWRIVPISIHQIVDGLTPPPVQNQYRDAVQGMGGHCSVTEDASEWRPAQVQRCEPDRKLGARGKRRSFSPRAAARHSQPGPARVHTNSRPKHFFSRKISFRSYSFLCLAQPGLRANWLPSLTPSRMEMEFVENLEKVVLTKIKKKSWLEKNNYKNSPR